MTTDTTDRERAPGPSAASDERIAAYHAAALTAEGLA